MKPKVWGSRWERVDVMEGGGQGRTYRVIDSRDPERGPSFVLKELKSQNDRNRRRRMNAEVANLQVLDHPGIARVVESNSHLWQERDELYLVTEFVPGLHLAAQVAHHGIPSLSEAVGCVCRLCDILAYCHNQGVVHRDVKPENIIVRDGHWKDPVLLDFGVSFNEDGPAVDGLTSTDEGFGNKFLRLPELDPGGVQRSPMTDVTAAAGVLFFLVTGRVPRVLVDEHGQAPHEREHALNSLQQALPSHARALQRVFQTAFRPPLQRRWPNALSLRQAVEDVMNAPAGDEAGWDLEAALRELRDGYDRKEDPALRQRIVDAFEAMRMSVDRITTSMNKTWSGRMSHGRESVADDPREGKFATTIRLEHRLEKRPSSVVRLLAEVDGAVLSIRFGWNREPVEVGRVALHDIEMARAVSEQVERSFVKGLRDHLG